MVAGFRPRAELLHGVQGQREALGGPFGEQDGDPGHECVFGQMQEAAVDADRRGGEPADGVVRVAL